MDKELIASTLKKVKENSPKKNFKQSIDLIINLRGLDLKKTEHNVNIFTTLHQDTGKKISICAFVAPDMESKAKEVCDETILLDQFEKYKNKSEIKKLANKHDFFVAQASVMPKVATAFGRFLGPKGKMPNPKLGSVLPQNANIKPLYEKLKRTINLVTKNEPTIKCRVGQEDTTDNDIIDNILTVYNSTIQKLPNEKQNVKSVMLKLTMGPAFVLGKETEDKKTGKKATKIKSEQKSTEKPETQEKPEKEKPKKETKPKENKKEPKKK
jgi:large subunit ribosomal protein L1|tara:strand:- start:31720 stop:32526 length:807 start_codon:yes stop_codon:yes gene_type:complete